MTVAPSSESARRGSLVPIGGAEEKHRRGSILRRFVDLCGGDEARVVVIPTASRMRDTGRRYVELFQDMGARTVASARFRAREDCEDPTLLASLREATGVFMTGGNQTRLTGILAGTAALDALLVRHAEGMHVAGTSAGAAVMSRHMIAFGRSGETPYPGMVALRDGFGLTDELIVDQHFTQRRRLGRLMTAVAHRPTQLGVGVDEDTCLFLGPDGTFEVVGKGAVTVVDPSEMRPPRLDAPSDRPLEIVGLRLHTLRAGARYDVRRRAVLEEADR